MCRPTYDDGAKECTHEMGKEHNQCLIKRDDKTYLETYNCEYIKTPKPERFARAMVSTIYIYTLVCKQSVYHSLRNNPPCIYGIMNTETTVSARFCAISLRPLLNSDCKLLFFIVVAVFPLQNLLI